MNFKLLLIAAAAAAANAQDRDAPPSAFGPNQGIVHQIDKAAGEIIIRHGPLPEVDMPPMTMAFEVKHPGLLDKVKPGDCITLRVELLDGRFTVTAVERRP